MEGWEIVETVGTEEEAELVRGYLEAEGIPSAVESLRFHQDPVNFGALGEVRVLVPPEHLERAQRLIDEREEGAPELAEGESSDAGESDPRG
ncbi:MAG: DUF2007 domain-containing protein [Thermoanaerobaculia bacterium]|jgi:hypothetical protein